MEKEKTEALKEFMNYYTNDIVVQKIESVKLQDWDGEEGLIGENYVVKYSGVLIRRDVGGTDASKKYGTALVNVKHFERWYKKESAVKFID
jgi:hypothetical protein